MAFFKAYKYRWRMTPILFFNPTSFPSEEFKEVSFLPFEKYIPNIEFFDENGERCPVQVVVDQKASGIVVDQNGSKINAVIVNHVVKMKLPPFGTRVYWWRLSSSQVLKGNKALVLRDSSIEKPDTITDLE